MEGAPRPPGSKSPLARGIWFGLGLLCVALGGIGVVLPLMPTVVFLILAAGCFARSSPRLEAWILDHPVFGPPVRAWRARGAIPPRGKAMAVGGLAGGYTVFALAAQPAAPLALLVAAIMAAIGLWIVSRPT